MTETQLAVIEQRLQAHDESIQALRELSCRQQKSIEELTRIQERQAADDRRLVRHRKELDNLHDSLKEISDKFGEGRITSALNSHTLDRWSRWVTPIGTAVIAALIVYAVMGQ